MSGALCDLWQRQHLKCCRVLPGRGLTQRPIPRACHPLSRPGLFPRRPLPLQQQHSIPQGLQPHNATSFSGEVIKGADAAPNLQPSYKACCDTCKRNEFCNVWVYCPVIEGCSDISGQVKFCVLLLPAFLARNSVSEGVQFIGCQPFVLFLPRRGGGFDKVRFLWGACRKHCFCFFIVKEVQWLESWLAEQIWLSQAMPAIWKGPNVLVQQVKHWVLAVVDKLQNEFGPAHMYVSLILKLSRMPAGPSISGMHLEMAEHHKARLAWDRTRWLTATHRHKQECVCIFCIWCPYIRWYSSSLSANRLQCN